MRRSFAALVRERPRGGADFASWGYSGIALKIMSTLLAAMAAVLTLVVSTVSPATAAAPASQGVVPEYALDTSWPKLPLPNKWALGLINSIFVDTHNHLWLYHSPELVPGYARGAAANPPSGKCCVPAPAIIEFDEQGNVVRSWDIGPGRGYDAPSAGHGLYIDYKGNIWVGGSQTRTGANGSEPDGMYLKFSPDGKFLLQIGGRGLPPKGSLDTTHLFGAAAVDVDPATNEAYIADGYGNHRVIVFDADTGKYKRHWGAYGHKPDDTSLGRYNPADPPAQQFRNPVHCAELTNDRLLYVCDRVNDRIQVFKPDGTFVKETFVNKETRGSGSAWDIAFSRDPQQKYLYLADGENDRVHILDRQSLEMLTTFGEGGRQPGLFYGVHSIATDSKGNIYTTETYEGKRLQRFVYKGLGPVEKQDQGTPWGVK